MRGDSPDIFILDESMRVSGDFSSSVKRDRSTLKTIVFCTIL